MKLEELLGKELYEQVKTKIDEANSKETDKLKHIRYADLSEGGYISKEKYATLEADQLSKATELSKANDLIKQLKEGTGSDEELQGKIQAYETTVATLQAENEKLKVESGLKIALLNAGAKASDIDYLLFKANQNELRIESNGTIKGEEELISGLKTQCPGQFESTNQTGKYGGYKPIKPDGGSGGDVVTKSDLLKKSYNERIQFKSEHPEQYTEIMKG